MTTRKLGYAELIHAIFDRIDTNALTSTYAVYGYVPPGTAMPYVSVGNPMGVISNSFSSRDTEAEENVVNVHVYSKYQGDKECADMMNNIVQAITGSSLSITDYSTPYVMPCLDYSEILIDDSDPNNLVRHGVLRFRFHMSPS